nr:hypothetical protein [Tanacetum cinerariifolium]
MNYGSDLLIFLAYALSMPPLLSLLLSMTCDDSDRCVVKAVTTRILAGQPFRLAVIAGLYSLMCIVSGISSHFNFNTAHAFAVAISITTFSFIAMVTRMGYVAMIEYNYGLDTGYPPGGFRKEFRRYVTQTSNKGKSFYKENLSYQREYNLFSVLSCSFKTFKVLSSRKGECTHNFIKLEIKKLMLFRCHHSMACDDSDGTRFCGSCIDCNIFVYCDDNTYGVRGKMKYNYGLDLGYQPGRFNQGRDCLLLGGATC